MARSSKRARTGVEQYLDIEAEVDDIDDDADGDEEDDQFIEEEEIQADEDEYRGHAMLCRSIALNDERREAGAVWAGDDEAHRTLDRFPESVDEQEEQTIRASAFLYEIGCKPDYEEATVVGIFGLATSPEFPIPFAKSAISNPFHPGRIYVEPYVSPTEIESSSASGADQKNAAYRLYPRMVALARHFPALDSSSIRVVAHEDIIVPLIITPVPRKVYEWVKISRPRRLAGRVGFLRPPPKPKNKDEMPKPPDTFVLLPPNKPRKGFFPAPPPTVDSHDDVPPAEILGTRRCWYDQYGFEYVRITDVKPERDRYWPTVAEIQLAMKYGRIPQMEYRALMSRAQAYTLKPGDRVLIRVGDLSGLSGTVVLCNGSSAVINIPSLESPVSVPVVNLGREFRVGDRVSPAVDDVAERLGSRIGWVVADLGPKEGKRRNGAGIENAAGDLGVHVDLKVYSPESGLEIVAAHYEFTFADDVEVFGMPERPSQFSDLYVGQPCTLIIPGKLFRHKFHGRVGEVYALREHETRTSGNVNASSGTVLFRLWDAYFDTESYGDDQGKSVATERWSINMDEGFELGKELILEDENGIRSTARVLRLENREVLLGNFVGHLRIQPGVTSNRKGPFDHHVSKPVQVVKGADKGALGIVKTVNAQGSCTVELFVFPVRTTSLPMNSLKPVDISKLFMPASPPPPRSATPPPPAGEPFVDPYLSPPPPEVNPPPSADEPPPPEANCGWIDHPWMLGIPVKLRPASKIIERPYHLVRLERNFETIPSELIAVVLDRKEEKRIPLDRLAWLPATKEQQTVVHIHGTDGTLYRTIRESAAGVWEVRKTPSKRYDPVLFFQGSELAQVNAPRSKGKGN